MTDKIENFVTFYLVSVEMVHAECLLSNYTETTYYVLKSSPIIFVVLLVCHMHQR